MTLHVHESAQSLCEKRWQNRQEQGDNKVNFSVVFQPRHVFSSYRLKTHTEAQNSNTLSILYSTQRQIKVRRVAVRKQSIKYAWPNITLAIL